MQFYIAVKGIVRKDGKILTMKRSSEDVHQPGVWETIGGGMDEKESPQEALKREVMEEAGIEVEVGNPFNIFSFTNDEGKFKVGITFLCDYVSGEVFLSDEHDEYKWIEPSEFKNLKSIQSLYDEIEKYNQKYGKK